METWYPQLITSSFLLVRRTYFTKFGFHKSKCTVHPKTGHEGPEGEQRYSSTLALNSALDRGGWSKPRLSRFIPGMSRYPSYRRLGGPQGRSGQVGKISPPPGFDPLTVKPVASRNNDYTIPAHFDFRTLWNYVLLSTLVKVSHYYTGDGKIVLHVPSC